ncbi:hypothetical protein HNQ07_004709 [Deinococcus metalli]|uniref:Large polyvalent protein associated domain-containing protein n=1 Tax=Deinococcus metalli TaxID=1141878 RepID=A0A7W8KJ78_9DEIO|nr:hypothetical protein [Deinococcus metalli]MBB5379194.1 hypothetical protein [Deinococcus metalli]GHF65207.1 hypothetical protein GCM10017781_46180 [Deinococcus metalli]
MSGGFDFAAAAGIPKTKDGTPDFAAAAGIPTTQSTPALNAAPGTMDAKLFHQAVAKLKAGQTLTADEANAIARAQASDRTMAGIAWALQPLQALSDITKGVIGQMRGGGPTTTDLVTGGKAPAGSPLQRGLQAAGGHLTYGLAEGLPGMTGARARGVTGAELLKGTKYADNRMAALAVEVLADPSTFLTGAGFVVKGVSTAGRLADLEKFAKTADGAATIREALRLANARGDALLKAGDEITGVPAVIRGVSKTKPVQAAKGALSRLADQQLPEFPGAGAIRKEGGGTIGDAFLTPDQKAALYTPEQLARDDFRTTTRLGAEGTGQTIKAAAQVDSDVVMALTKGLKTSDATEVNRLLGVFTTATKPEVAAEALRKLGVISTRIGRNLEPAFVDAVKAADRVGQVTLGPALQARKLPVVLDPKVTEAIQKAQTGADLVPLVGRYTTTNGRPRGILMTQYVGRKDIPTTIKTLIDLPEIPAMSTVDQAVTVRSLDQAAQELPPLPAKPVEPVGVPARGALPVNPASTVEKVTTLPEPPAPAVTAVTPAAEPARVTPDSLLESFFRNQLPARDVTPGAAAMPPNTPSRMSDLTSPAAATEPGAPVITPPDQPRTADDVLRTMLDPAPRSTPDVQNARPAEVAPLATGTNRVEDLAPGMGAMGADIADSLHDTLYAKYLAGDTTELGKPSMILTGAAALKQGGVTLTRDQFPDFANRFFAEVQAARGSADGQAQVQKFLREYQPPATTTPVADVPSSTRVQTPPSAVGKTTQDVLRDLLRPAEDPYVALPSPAITRTPQAAVRDLALPMPAPERLVTKDIPTTYRTVQVDANALDWAALPDDSARRAVLNSIDGAGNARFVRDAQGAIRLDRPNLTVPLSHPTISRYFTDDELLAAQRQGTELGERTVTRREQVPHWYDPKGAPLETQRAMVQQAQREASEADFPNQQAAIESLHAAHDDTSWIIGDAFASYDRLVKPSRIDTRAASNQYAARVRALTGTPPTRGDVFQYRLQLARYRQAANLRTVDTRAVTTHLNDFFRENPEATLYEGALSTARAFDLGSAGAKHVQQVLRQAESGFERQMSRLERLEFAQYFAGKTQARRGGGTLVDRLKRNPDAVSQEFTQVFAQDVNTLRLIDEQVRTRTAAIVRQDVFRSYRDYLRDSGQLITQKKLAELRMIPEHRLTPDQREMRTNAATALSRPGAPAAWKVMDRDIEGYFSKGDVLPWWAYFDLFGASGVEDTAVSAAILNRGGLDIYNRLWSTKNAQMLGTPSSIVNDQVGQLLQMGMWGVTPDAVIEGIIRRATASPEALDTMRKSGIQSAKLESNLGASREELTRLAARLDGDTDLTRTQRIIDKVLRFRERGTGLDRTAMTGVAGVAADFAHFGSGYFFQLRSALSDLQREALYFHRLQLGDTPGRAAQYANEVMLDMRLVPAYARVVRRYWPFFNWIAMSGPRSIVTILRKPGIAAAYHRIAQGSDNPNDRRDATRRVLARDGGYINLGLDERSGARLYLDPRNWDPTNTIPQLLDWSGTKIGAASPPYYVNLLVTLQWGQDRFGRNIYADVLDGGTGGFTEAYANNPKGALIIAGKTLLQEFAPTYAPGSPRAQAFVRSVLATAKLPDDGSKDISLARMLAGTPQGRAYLTLMQNGSFALIERDLTGTRDSPYTDAAPSMARAAANYLVPIRAVDADQYRQGTAQQTVSVAKLRFDTWLASEKKKLALLEAGGASQERIQLEERRIDHEAEVKGAQLDYLDTITR